MLGQRLDEVAHVIQVPREPIHAMHDHGIANTHKREQHIALRPLRIFARRLVGKGAIKFNAVELALGVLLDRASPAHSQRADRSWRFAGESVSLKSMTSANARQTITGTALS